MVPMEGLEPTLPNGKEILSLSCLPFHHIGINYILCFKHLYIIVESTNQSRPFSNTSASCISMKYNNLNILVAPN